MRHFLPFSIKSAILERNIFGMKDNIIEEEAAKENDKAYDKFRYYMIDGYIVSDNVTVNNVETLDLGFENSDHNPIVMDLTLE